MDVTLVARQAPGTVADQLLALHADDPDWLDRFVELLDRRRHGRDLERILRTWGLNHTDAGSAFGVTRQAVAKWLDRGIPGERAAMIADVAATTDLLVRHLKRDRIPAVVRRPAPALGGRSLLDLLAAGQTRLLFESVRTMFSFGDAHA